MSKHQKNFANPPKSPKNQQKSPKHPPKGVTKTPPKDFKSAKHPPKPSVPNPTVVDEILDFNQVNYVAVGENQDGQRLDNFLLARLKGLPRSHLYKMIRDDEIRINKKRAKPHERLMVGDVVRIAPVRLSTPTQAIVGDDIKELLLSKIVYEDDGLIVLNKPYGMAVHGGSGESVGVIEALRVATDKKYLELIHRIDKGTSGLLLIAKKRSTLKALQDQLRAKTLQKTYVCLVSGHLTKKQQTIDKPLFKYTLPSGERRVKVSTDGKPSVTDVRVLAEFMLQNKPVSVVQASPKTGRTHQIRVHMQSIGHPLLGDDKYFVHDPFDVKRLCLHAYRLMINQSNMPSDTTDDKQKYDKHVFIASLPDDFCVLMGDELPKVMAMLDKLDV